MLVFLLLMETQLIAGVTHSLKYFYSASFGVTNFPEFVVVGLVDDAQVFQYDSDTRTTEPKQDWMKKVTEDDPHHWERNSRNFVGTQKNFKAIILSIKQRFNQTGGVHVLQNMVGCEWDDETGEVKGYSRFGYDGEDFIALDQKLDSWIAQKPEAVITKHKWDQDKIHLSLTKNYLTQICPEWVKKYVNYGSSSLMRTERPSVYLLQKTSSSPVSCHATGFYPNRAQMFWRKDGDETHEGVDKGEVVPNNDGTFQMTVDLRVSSDSSEDWTKYECVFQLSGEDDMVTRLDQGRVRTNQLKPADMIVPIVVVLVVLAAIIIVVVGVILYKKEVLPCKNNHKRSPSRESQKSNEKMLPKA